jgi:hypothetical protein
MFLLLGARFAFGRLMIEMKTMAAGKSPLGEMRGSY